MHVALAWDINKQVTKERKDEIFKLLREAFGSWKWISPIDGFHIVKIENADERDKIHAAVIEKVKQIPEGAYFVISPAMPSGSNYNGWLPKDWWPKLRERTS